MRWINNSLGISSSLNRLEKQTNDWIQQFYSLDTIKLLFEYSWDEEYQKLMADCKLTFLFNEQWAVSTAYLYEKKNNFEIKSQWILEIVQCK